MYLDGCSLRVRLERNNPGRRNDDVLLRSDTGSITAGAWHHVTLAFAEEETLLYLNGELVDGSTEYKHSLTDNTANVVFAASNSRTNDRVLRVTSFFRGRLDDIALFGSPLNPQESRALLKCADTDDCDASVVPENFEDISTETFVFPSAGPPTAPEPLSLGVISMYDFDERPGAKVAFDKQRITDGEFLGDVELGQPGALDFTGTSMKLDGDGYVRVTHTDALSLRNGSLSFWFKRDSIPRRQRSDTFGLLSKTSPSSLEDGQLSIYLKNRNLIVTLEQSQCLGGQVLKMTSARLENVEEWNHVLVSWGEAGTRLFINGALQTAARKFDTGLHLNPEDVAIGTLSHVTSH